MAISDLTRALLRRTTEEFQCRITARKKFVLLSRYRSGSNLLLRALKQSPEVVIRYELFNVSELRNDPKRAEDPGDFINRVFGSYYRGWPKAVGFKLMYGQATRAELDEQSWGPNLSPRIRQDIRALRQRLLLGSADGIARLESVWRLIAAATDIRIVHLTRANPFDGYISFQLAMLGDEWNRHPYSVDSINIDKQDLLEWFEQGRRYERRYDELFADHPLLKISYESLASDYGQVTGRVCQFLGVAPPQHITVPMDRQKTRSNDRIVRNLEEIQAEFAGTRWRPFIR